MIETTNTIICDKCKVAKAILRGGLTPPGWRAIGLSMNVLDHGGFCGFADTPVGFENRKKDYCPECAKRVLATLVEGDR